MKCETCYHWGTGGECARLSGRPQPEGYREPRQDTGIIAYPVCWHDGAADCAAYRAADWAAERTRQNRILTGMVMAEAKKRGLT